MFEWFQEFSREYYGICGVILIVYLVLNDKLNRIRDQVALLHEKIDGD
jgi:hypothetical protein